MEHGNRDQNWNVLFVRSDGIRVCDTQDVFPKTPSKMVRQPLRKGKKYHYTLLCTEALRALYVEDDYLGDLEALKREFVWDHKLKKRSEI